METVRNATTDVLLAGVGGQGTILAGKVLARAAQLAGRDVKVSEVHGMAQRGGSVVTQVRFGPSVRSPLIAFADVLVAFEQLEGLRWLPRLKAGATVILNRQTIYPLPVLTGAAAYPQGIPATVRARGFRTLVVDGPALAAQAGSAKAVNMVLVGALAAELDLPGEAWSRALEELVPAAYREVNLTAFDLGRAAAGRGPGAGAVPVP
ncbi:MAG: indolepyruvate oxidoreductase subunit beta [Desulfotomaculales bacterium]